MTAALESPPPAQAPPATRWSAVVAVAAASVLAAADMSIVAVALPVIGTEFTASVAATQWVMLAYLLPMVALAVPVGRWMDRAQARATFLLATAGFGVASALIMIAPTFGTFLASRAVQGVFAAVIGVMGFPIVATSVRPEHRARAMSIVLTLIPLAAVIGPVLGGFLTELYGWRAVFAINIPIVLVALWLGHHSIRAGSDDCPALPLPDRRLAGETLVLGVAVASLLLGIDLLGRSPAELGGPAALIALTVVTVTFWARHPVSRPVRGFLAGPQRSLQLVAMLLMTTSVGAVYFMVPHFLAGVLGRAPADSGLVLLALAAPMAVTSPIAGYLADRIGTRPVLVAGGAATLAAMVALALLGPSPHPADVAWRLALVGVGQGLFAGPNSAAILAATPPSLAGTGGGMTALFRTLGFTVGPAIGALVFSLTGGGAAAFRAGALVLVAAALGTIVATAKRS